MTRYHLAQINIGIQKAPMTSPQMRDFADNLDAINALADASPGFVWRLKGEGSNNATDIRPTDHPDLLLNMSVWANVESLAAFVYRTDHRTFMRRRAEWFEKIELYMALWWIPEGHVPSAAEGMAAIESLRRHGPSVAAFTFREPFPAPGAAEPEPPVWDECA